nr:hypothetical protein [Candidatus Sigynarchaeota archaeon]
MTFDIIIHTNSFRRTSRSSSRTNQVVTKFLGTMAVEDAVGGNIVAHGCHFRYRLKAKGASYNETLERSITVVDSVDLAPGTATFFITEAGIADDEKIAYKIKDVSPYELKPSFFLVK